MKHEDRLASWLAKEVCPVELARERLREALLARCRVERLEPPAAGQLGRVVGSGLRRFEEGLCERTVGRLPGGAVGHLEGLIAEGETEGGRVERIPYELCVSRALREAIRRREIYVCGASRWRDPEEDLPVDFEANREIHYDAIRKPLDPAVFVTDLQRRLREKLGRLDGALADGRAGGVRITTRRGEPWISVPKLDKLPEPANLEAVKAEVERRWGNLDLLDVLKEADHLAGFTGEFTSVASREVMAKETLRRRLLLVLFALGTNVGIKGITDGLTEPADLGDNEATGLGGHL